MEELEAAVTAEEALMVIVDLALEDAVPRTVEDVAVQVVVGHQVFLVVRFRLLLLEMSMCLE